MNANERKQKIWEEIIKETQEKSPTKRPGEMSRSEFARLAGVSKETAKDILDQLVKDGKMTERETTRATLYSPIV